MNASADDRMKKLYGDDAHGETYDDDPEDNALSGFWASVPWSNG